MAPIAMARMRHECDSVGIVCPPSPSWDERVRQVLGDDEWGLPQLRRDPKHVIDDVSTSFAREARGNR